MTARVSDLTHLPHWPRLMSRDQAAAYCGVSDETLSKTCPVHPVRIGARVLYDIRALDAWVDSLAGVVSGKIDWAERL